MLNIPPEIHFEKKRCLHTLLWAGLSFVCVCVVGGIYLYLLVSACVRTTMALCFYACVSASLVCWFFIHSVKKRSVPMRVLFFSHSPLFLGEREREKAFVWCSCFAAVTQVKHVTCFMHIHNFFPSQDIEHKHRQKTEHISHFFSQFNSASLL